MNSLRYACTMLMAALASCVSAPAVSTDAPTRSEIAIVGANVLSMTDRGRLPNQTILIVGDRISRVGPRDAVSVPDGYRIIDGQGLTVMPGLVDMHVHLAKATGEPGDAAQRALAVMLGHGVTTARSMAGQPEHLEVRAAVERGEIAGPRIYAAGPAINFTNTTTTEAARASVAAAKEAGFDLIKSHHITDVAVWQAVQDEARTQGIPTSGHVTNEVGLERALAADQQIEHLDGAIMELLQPGAPERDIEFGQVPPPAVILAAANAPRDRYEALADKVAAADSYQTPTLALFELILDLDVSAETLAASPDMRFIPDAAIAQWKAQRGQLAQMGFTAEDGERLSDIRRRIVAAYHKAGVPIMAGSDTAQAFHIWGPGLIREIEALAAAGMTPIEALRSATVVPRDYFRSLPNGGSALGWEADFGTVQEGARADLILLAEDPSEDLAALRTLQTVIAGGEVHDRAALDAMLAKAAADAKSVSTPAADVAARDVYIMRHLPAGEGGDPALTAEGARLASRLADFLGSADLEAIYVTDTRRSRETAAAIAAKSGITPTVYDPRRPDALVAAAGEVEGDILVIGHSNTVPDLVRRFGGTPPPPLGHDDFGDIWRIDEPDDTRHFRLAGTPPAALGPCSTPGLPPQARCGSITVPENREQPSGRMIDIHFAVLPATGEGGDAPLVVLPGGPGLGGVQAAPGFTPVFASMRGHRDILAIDQRGTGQSNPLRCPLPDDSGDALGRLGGTPPEEVIACREALEGQADLGAYVTREAVLDMEQVRAALGYDTLDLFGMSYGSRVALDYLRLYPEHVGQTVIRAAAPAAMRLPLWTPRDAQRSYDRLVAACRAQPDCAARYPDLDKDLRTIVARLEKGPVPITIVDPRNGQKITTELDREGLSSVLFFLLYIPQFYVQLPPLIDAAAEGNMSPLVQAAAPALIGTVDQIAWGLRWSVICDEDVRRIDEDEVAAATKGTFMGAQSVRAEMDACALWPRADVPADYLEPVESEKPVFIISGYMDPVAGKVWGDQIAQTLPNSVHVEVDGASHLPPLPGCTAELMKAFLNRAELDTLDLTCVGEAERPKLRVGA